MKNSVLSYLPTILIAIFILYFFLCHDKNLTKAINEIKVAKNEINSSLLKVDSASNNLILIHSQIKEFDENSDSLYTLFNKTSTEFINSYKQNLKPNMDKLRSALAIRTKQEKEEWKPINIINQ